MPTWLKESLAKLLKAFKSNFIDTIQLKKLKTSIEVTENTTSLNVALGYSSSKHIPLIFCNGIYMEQDSDYTITKTGLTFTKEIQASVESPVEIKIVFLYLEK